MSVATDLGLNIADIGSFFVGGRTVTLSGQPRRKVQVARNSEVRLVDLNGDYVSGQCYVHYARLSAPAFDAPVMFWHGGAMTGATWETTPDGRPGWQMHFLRRGFDCFVCDAVERGRAGWSPFPEIYASEPIFRTMDEAWSLFRLGPPNGYVTEAADRQAHEGCLFPVEMFTNFAAQFVPRWTEHGAVTLDAYLAALRRTGQVWLIAHSQGANLALEAVARQPSLFRGVLLIEPAAAPSIVGPAVRVPHLFVWGDFIGQSPLWMQYRASSDTYAKRLADTGCPVETIELPDLLGPGNTHAPMMDRNSDEVADLILDWIDRASA